MKIGGSESCGQLVGFGCFVATATLVAMAALHASGVFGGMHAYKVAVGCGITALVSAAVGVIFCGSSCLQGEVGE